jgi:hypothetical protein
MVVASYGGLERGGVGIIDVPCVLCCYEEKEKVLAVEGKYKDFMLVVV